MNLEQIDTSTTAGKAEVMRLAAEGRRVALRGIWSTEPFYEMGDGYEICWNWESTIYAIISEPVGPEEVWLVIDHSMDALTEASAKSYAEAHGLQVVRYRRADLAGEKQ
ncbi:hypothetical protein CCR98_07730 [Stenotrophomonas sp. WZN-1]|uniref:hypothetical protein n=1 Tax=Stenotrophomonas sp. WZN-1 TaxID=2005046 RepID=UPI000B43F678|nr:hypothetical protein [Stenotrophomonas sp. WZN-1]ARZ74064.1 hypothetical protein CCR98_07730 [Stenotrophomonas sp. WZN-1]